MNESGELGSGPRFITATLQSNFCYCIGEFLKRMNEGLIYESWIALETLHAILPPEIYDRKIVKAHFNEVKRFMVRDSKDRTSFMEQRRGAQETLAYLKARNLIIFREVYAMLYQGGYLEKIKNVSRGEFEG